MTIATCRGTSSGGNAGGRAPEGCGVGCLAGGRTGDLGRADLGLRRDLPLSLDMAERAQTALEMPGEVRRNQRARLSQVPLLGGRHDVPVPGEERGENLDGLPG